MIFPASKYTVPLQHKAHNQRMHSLQWGARGPHGANLVFGQSALTKGIAFLEKACIP